MKKFTKLWQLMLILLLSSSVVFAQKDLKQQEKSAEQKYSTTNIMENTMMQKNQISKIEMEKLLEVEAAQIEEKSTKEKALWKEMYMNGGNNPEFIKNPIAPNYNVKGVLDCPPGSQFSQSAVGYTNGANGDIDGGYKLFQYFSGLTEDVTSITFWGINAYYSAGWFPCSEDPRDYKIVFYGDNAGMPDTLNVLYTFNVNLDGFETGEMFAGTYEILKYSYAFAPNLTGFTDGWVSVQGNPGGDPDCWFLWVSSGTAGTTCQQLNQSTGTWVSPPPDYPLSLCLGGSLLNHDVGVTGVVTPQTGVLTAAEVVEIEIFNYGANAETNFPVNFTFEGNTYTETYTGPINSGDFDTYTFTTQTIDCSIPGPYTLTACTVLPDDEDTGNDCYVHNFDCVVPAYCAASGGCDEYITDVIIGSISNTGTPCDNYMDYTALSTDLTQGQTAVSITIANGNPYSSDDLGIWIDWNQDMDFYGADENVVCEFNNGGQGTFTFDVPAGATLGSTRMRIRIKYSGDDCGDPCGTTTYGEVEDYTINVLTAGPCPAPTNLTTTDITDASARANWSDANHSRNYNVEWGLPGFTPEVDPIGSGNVIFAHSQDPYDFLMDYGLSAATNYEWYVQSDCGTDAVSLWAGPAAFNTTCPISFPVPFVESFDLNATPLCWLNYCTTGDGWEFGQLGDAGYAAALAPDHTGNGGYYAWVDFSGTDVGVVLEAPDVDVSTLTLPWLEFYLFSHNTNSSDYNILHVEAWDGAAWASVAILQGDNGGWTEYAYDLTAFTYGANLVKIRFRAESCGATGDYYNDLLIDDISIDEGPTCFKPTGLGVANVTDVSADLLWTSNSGHSNIEWGYKGFTLGVDPLGTDTDVTSPYPLFGLSMYTEYDFYVQDDCTGTGGGLSEWAGPYSFTTACYVTCPIGSTPEGEPCGDTINNGCNLVTPLFGSVSDGETICGNTWDDGSIRDTDWYELVTTDTYTRITLIAEAEIEMVFGQIEQIVPGVPGCGNITGYISPYMVVPPCDADTLIFELSAAGTYYIFAAQSGWFGNICPGSVYWFSVDVQVLAPPAAVIDPMSFSATLPVDGNASADLNIGNTGEITLTYTADVVYPTPPGTTLESEDFDAGIPVTWTIVDGGTSTDTWYGATDHYGSTLDGTPFAFVNSDAAGYEDMDEQLISPAFDATGYVSVLLEFDQYFNEYSGGPTEIGDVDVWDGTAWQNVYTTSSDVGGWSNPDHQTIDIVGYANAAMQVRFHYYNANYDFYWAVDNVLVKGFLTLPQPTGWLTLDGGTSTSGSVLTGDTDIINVGFDATGIPVGVYTADIEIETNEPTKVQNYSLPVTLTVVANGYTVSGTLTYANTASTPMDLVNVKLMSGTTEYGSAITDLAGGYNIIGTLVANGSYTLISSTTKTWGGLNGLDIILTKRFMGGLHTFTPLQILAADVNESGAPDGLDIIMMKRRMGGLSIPAWKAPDYVYHDVAVTVAGANVIHNYQSLCSGDVNGDYTPPVATVVFFDDFDTYTAGTQLTVQNPIDWTTWSGPPGTGEDPYVSNAQASSVPNSVVIVQDNDLIKPLGGLTSGVHVISFQGYIPTGKSGYFNIMSEFGASNYWAIEIYFDAGGAGRLLTGDPDVAFTWTEDTWQMCEVIIDLNNDLANFYFDGTLLHSWQWTNGTSAGFGPLQLDVVDFFGATANDEMYFDDFNILAQ